MNETFYEPRLLNATDQQQAAAGTLTRAFDADPLMTYIVPGQLDRAAKLPGFFQSCLEYGHKTGQVYVAPRQNPTETAGVAIWLGPAAHPDMTLGRLIQNKMAVKSFKVMLDMGVGATRRLLNVGDHTEKMHKLYMTKAHWYLMFLGVEPVLQGKGIGGQLLQPILGRAKADGLPCYLETMNPKNVPFYQKHGFEIVGTSQIPKGGPPMWSMAYFG